MGPLLRKEMNFKSSQSELAATNAPSFARPRFESSGNDSREHHRKGNEIHALSNLALSMTIPYCKNICFYPRNFMSDAVTQKA